MTGDDVLTNIEALSHEEHQLREREGQQQLSDQERERLTWVEERLDQCWDLLRQRRARVHAGLDPDEAGVRDVETVEHYRQ
jgi:Rad3-related DNA helicase